ncbi:MAG: hypothetical protein L0Z73_05950 [Gammaproteobacteria bacterium]|nr:hypothetical protein [Gammaproteobacteria bacterium]
MAQITDNKPGPAVEQAMNTVLDAEARAKRAVTDQVEQLQQEHAKNSHRTQADRDTLIKVVGQIAVLLTACG